MHLPPEVRDKVERRLKQYCRDRIPERIRHQLRVTYRILGDYVTLVEERPSFFDPGTWSQVAVAQFRFRTQGSNWLLDWADRNSRCHACDDLEPSDDLDDLLAEADPDPTGVFLG